MTHIARRGALARMLAGLAATALPLLTRNVEARDAKAGKAVSHDAEAPSAPAGRLKQSRSEERRVGKEC